MRVSGRSEVKVWDLPTRVFHWTLVALVLAEFFLASDKGLVFRIHTYAGYVILLLVLFRLAWGFAGGEHARFSDFVRPWSDVREHMESLLAPSPPRHVGHNPAGGWMIMLMLVCLTLIVITGMMGAVSEGAVIPMFAGLSRGISRPIKEIHEFLGNAMMGLVGIHVLGVVVAWWLTRDNLVRAMIVGTKESWSGSRDARTVGLWRALLIIAALVPLGIYLVMRTSF